MTARDSAAGTDAPPSALRVHLELAKPGIIAGNLITTLGGFALGSGGTIDGARLVATLLGVALVIAGGCVVNNVIDRDIDARMVRTRRRVMVRGLAAPGSMLVYGALLGSAGLVELVLTVGYPPAATAAFGLFVYVLLYSLVLKRRSSLGILVGSLAGAAPPVIGYCAASGRLDLGAGLLLAIFSLWQLPHSHAIGILHADDYAAAGVPARAVSEGAASAKRRVVVGVAMFALATTTLTFAGYTGWVHLAVMSGVNAYWLAAALVGSRGEDDRRWARRMFLLSILAVVALSAATGLARADGM